MRAVEGEGHRYRHRSPRTVSQELTPPRRSRIASDPDSKSPAAQATGEAGRPRPRAQLASAAAAASRTGEKTPPTPEGARDLSITAPSPNRSSNPTQQPIRRTERSHDRSPERRFLLQASTPEEPRPSGRKHRKRRLHASAAMMKSGPAICNPVGGGDSKYSVDKSGGFAHSAHTLSTKERTRWNCPHGNPST